jgi:hypothetical protein
MFDVCFCHFLGDWEGTVKFVTMIFQCEAGEVRRSKTINQGVPYTLETTNNQIKYLVIQTVKFTEQETEKTQNSCT